MPCGRRFFVLLYAYARVEKRGVECLNVCDDELDLFFDVCIRVPRRARGPCRSGVNLARIMEVLISID